MSEFDKIFYTIFHFTHTNFVDFLILWIHCNIYKSSKHTYKSSMQTRLSHSCKSIFWIQSQKSSPDHNLEKRLAPGVWSGTQPTLGNGWPSTLHSNRAPSPSHNLTACRSCSTNLAGLPLSLSSTSGSPRRPKRHDSSTLAVSTTNAKGSSFLSQRSFDWGWESRMWGGYETATREVY